MMTDESKGLDWLVGILTYDENLITSAKIENRPCNKPIEGIMCKGPAMIERTSDEKNDNPSAYICCCANNWHGGDN